MLVDFPNVMTVVEMCMHTEILHYITSGIIVSLSNTRGGFVNKATETVNVNRTSEQKLLYFNLHTLIGLLNSEDRA